MKSISSLTSAVATVLLAARYASADPVAVAAPSTTIQLKAMTSEGCYSSSTGLTFNSTYTYQTSGWCQPICVEMNQAVLGLSGGNECYCGNLIPPASSKVDDSYCNDPCAGYDTEMCGGDSYYTVYLSGTKTNVANADASSSSSTISGSATTSVKPSVVTVGGTTILVTATGQASSASAAAAAAASKASSSKAGIAAGVVVGVVAITAVAGGAYLFMRARKRREIEEEHRRNAAVSSFVSGKPQSSGGSSFTDTRLDPAVMAQRRQSDGSIADNQDYSRRILKVTNA